MFITLEGNEGTGKSTQLAAVSEALIKHGHEVVQVREPGSTEIGEEIRSLFKNPPEGSTLTPRCETFLISAARNQLIHEVIKPALERGAIVIADRHTDSTIVYQGHLKGLPLDEVIHICQLATEGLEPDLTFLFELDESVLQSRVQARNDTSDRFDLSSSEEKEKINSGFSDCAASNPKRFIKIDATNRVQDITNEIVNRVLESMDKN